MARILICGTLAYDLIGRFETPLGPETRNVKLAQLDQGFGGCAMNMAYNLARLGHEAVPLVYVGADYEPLYAAHVRKSGIGEAGILQANAPRSAQGIVLTGSDDAQFTAFYPGPSGLDRLADDLRVLTARYRFDAAILAPDLSAKTLVCATAIGAIPLRIWCPGQYAELTDPAHVQHLLASVDLVIANHHESEFLAGPAAATEPTGASPGRAGAARPRLVVTRGPEPVLALPGDLRIPVPVVPPEERIDPTGCGDAFAAALTAALTEGRPLAAAIRAGIDVAGRCLRHTGAQRH